MNQRYVVLGAAGFIGYHLSCALSKQTAAELLLVDSLIRGSKDTLFSELTKKENVSFKKLDLSKEVSYKNLFLPNDIIFNLVALNGTQNFYEQPSEVLMNSALPSLLAPKFASEVKATKYIYFGSSESYAGAVNLGIVNLPTLEDVPFVIEDPTNPRWSYAVSKQIGEIACHAFIDSLDTLILRIHNIYGPRMGFEHVVPDLIRNFHRGDGTVLGGEQSRSFLFIDDAIGMIMACLATKLKTGSIINIGSDVETKILDLAKLIRELMDVDINLKHSPAPVGSVSRRIANTILIKKIYQRELIDIREGLKRTIAWYAEN